MRKLKNPRNSKWILIDTPSGQFEGWRHGVDSLLEQTVAIRGAFPMILKHMESEEFLIEEEL